MRLGAWDLGTHGLGHEALGGARSGNLGTFEVEQWIHACLSRLGEYTQVQRQGCRGQATDCLPGTNRLIGDIRSRQIGEDMKVNKMGKVQTRILLGLGCWLV